MEYTIKLIVLPQECGCKWSIYEHESSLKIATFQSEFEAYSARRAILKSFSNSYDKQC